MLLALNYHMCLAFQHKTPEEMQKCRNAEMQKCRNAEMQKCRNADMQKCRDAEMQKYGNAEIQKCRNAEMQKCRNADMQKCLGSRAGVVRDVEVMTFARVGMLHQRSSYNRMHQRSRCLPDDSQMPLRCLTQAYAFSPSLRFPKQSSRREIPAKDQ